MRSVVTAIVSFVCCVLTLVTIMTIGSFNLQRDELVRAVDFAAKQTVRQCAAEGITKESEIESVLVNAFKSQINSKKGTLKLYILYADENAVDIAADFTYTQYNGTEKKISCRNGFNR